MMTHAELLKWLAENIRRHEMIVGDHMDTVHQTIDAELKAAEDTGLLTVAWLANGYPATVTPSSSPA